MAARLTTIKGRQPRKFFRPLLLTAGVFVGSGYAARRVVRNGAVISSNHGWRWMASASFSMRA